MLFCFVFFRAIIEQKKRKSSSLSLFMKDGEKRKEKVFLSLSLFKRDGEKSKEMKRKLKKVEGSMKKRKKKRQSFHFLFLRLARVASWKGRKKTLSLHLNRDSFLSLSSCASPRSPMSLPWCVHPLSLRALNRCRLSQRGGESSWKGSRFDLGLEAESAR